MEARRARAWYWDPVVWLSAIFGSGATGYALFAGRYVPYIDWAAHLGLISVLAHGGSTGATAFFERSWAPSPYLLFYALSAIIGQIVPVDVAARLVMVIAAGALAFGAASLAEATGRSARLGAIGPLALFSISMGWGFGSFVLAIPVLFFALGSYERLLHNTAEGPLSERPWPLKVLPLSIWLDLLFLAHGFLFAAGVLLLGIRAVIRAVAQATSRRNVKAGLGPLLLLAGSLILPVGTALPSAIHLIKTPTIEAGTASLPAIEFTPLKERFQSMAGDLLERGSVLHLRVMYEALALLALWLLWSLIRPVKPRRASGCGIEIHAAILTAIYLFGPMSVNWPSSIWMIYPRFGVIAALAIFLVPRPDLSGKAGTLLALLPLIPAGHNAALNAGHVKEFSSWAAPYDEVRRAIPKGARVLALTAFGPGEPGLQAHAIGSLWGYHMVDGASYVAYLFDKMELPVHQKRSVTIRAPHWSSAWTYDPATHGIDYDFVVIHGEPLAKRTIDAGLHDLIGQVEGWTVFKTKAPRPVADETKGPPKAGPDQGTGALAPAGPGAR